MNTQVADRCSKESLEKNLPFPEVVRRLSEAGVEHYFADLIRKNKIHYGMNGDVHSVSMPFEGLGSIPEEFDAEAVRMSLGAIQRREISYPQFLRQIMEAGTWSYHVFLKGRCAVYFGRSGEFHIERFPGS